MYVIPKEIVYENLNFHINAYNQIMIELNYLFDGKHIGASVIDYNGNGSRAINGPFNEQIQTAEHHLHQHQDAIRSWENIKYI